MASRTDGSPNRCVAAAVLSASLLALPLEARTGHAAARPLAAPAAAAAPLASSWLDALLVWARLLLAGPARSAAPAAAGKSAAPPPPSPPAASSCRDRGASSDPDGICRLPAVGGG